MGEKLKDPDVRIANFLGYTFYPWNNTEGRRHGWQKHEYKLEHSEGTDFYLCKHKNELCFGSNPDRMRLVLDKLRRLGFDFYIKCVDKLYSITIEGDETAGLSLTHAVYNGVLNLLDKYGDSAWPKPKNKQH